MRRIKYLLLFLAFLFIGAATMTGCKAGYGCQAEEQFEKNRDKPLKDKKRKKAKLF